MPDLPEHLQRKIYLRSRLFQVVADCFVNGLEPSEGSIRRGVVVLRQVRLGGGVV